jgi:hypothetical protein
MLTGDPGAMDPLRVGELGKSNTRLTGDPGRIGDVSGDILNKSTLEFFRISLIVSNSPPVENLEL